MNIKKSRLIKESIADAEAITKISEKRAGQMFIKEFAPGIKAMLSDVINENVSTGNDNPSGYNPEEDQDAINSGTDINDGTGDGPEKLQETDTEIPDENQDEVVEEEFEAEPEEDEFQTGEVDENEIDFSEVPEDETSPEDEMYEGDGSEDIDLDTEVSPEDDEVIEIVDTEVGNDDENDEVPVMEKKIKETKRVNESKLKAYAKQLQKENQNLKNAVKKLREGFDKLNLFNAKLAYAFKLMRQPAITRVEKKQIAEAFDKVQSISEAKRIYEIFSKKIVEVKVTKKNPLQNKNVKPSTSETTKKLNETVSNRMAELAFGTDEQ